MAHSRHGSEPQPSVTHHDNAGSGAGVFSMQSLSSCANLGMIRHAIAAIPMSRDSLGPYLANIHAGGRPKWCKPWPIADAIFEIEQLLQMQVQHVQISRLNAGDRIGQHTDEACGERWHLPITTNPECVFVDSGTGTVLHMGVGRWWGPVEYQRPHEVWNDGETDRIHLICDLS